MVTEAPLTTKKFMMDIENEEKHEAETAKLIVLNKPKIKCEETNCNFEKDTKCGWADLRMLSRHFNNISVAMKKSDGKIFDITRS